MPLTILGKTAVPRDPDPHVSRDEHWPDAECQLRGSEHDFDVPALVIPPSANDFWEKLKTEPGYGSWELQPDETTKMELMLDIVSGLISTICDECKRRILKDIFITLMVERAIVVTRDELPKPELVN